MLDPILEIEAHIGWLTTYAETMTEENWRDHRLYILRQLQRLSECVSAKPAKQEQLFPSPHEAVAV